MDTSAIITEVVVRLGADTTVGYYTDSMFERWADQAHRWAVAYKRWPFTEGKVTTTYVSGTEVWSYPEGWRSDSIRLLQVGGKRIQKTNFEDYQIYREQNDGGSEKIFSDFNREYYINPNIDASGSITVWGQYTPASLTGNTLFTGIEEEGNEAMINEIISYAKYREQKPQEALAYHSTAMTLLEGLWKRIKDEQFAYHTKDRGMFERMDVLEGAVQDEILRRDQFI